MMFFDVNTNFVPVNASLLFMRILFLDKKTPPQHHNVLNKMMLTLMHA